MTENKWDTIWKVEKERSFNEVELDIVYCSSFQKIRKTIMDSNPKKFIEIGCGNGLTTLLISRNIQGNIYLFDKSQSALKLAFKNANRLKIEADYIQGDALSLPFYDDYFDLVLSLGVNEHFKGEERQRSFDEMLRITKLEGLCIVVVPNAFYIPLTLRRNLLIKKGMWLFGYEKPFSRGELHNRMQAAGASNIRIVNAEFFIGLHFLFMLIPFLNKYCRLENKYYRKFWNSLQRLDNLITVVPGLKYIATGEKRK